MPEQPLRGQRAVVTGASSRLHPLRDHLDEYGVGSIAELFDGDAPHAPNGCIAQAWSVAETLRAWRMLSALQQVGGDFRGA